MNTYTCVSIYIVFIDTKSSEFLLWKEKSEIRLEEVEVASRLKMALIQQKIAHSDRPAN